MLTAAAWNSRVAPLLTADRRALLLLVDLDRFAALNATYGHPAADHVLARVARALRDAVPGGIVGRFGGDEFVVLLPVAGVPWRRAADTARQAIADLVVRVDGPGGPVDIRGVTVSIGAAQLVAPGGGLADLLWAADRALYSAKRAGGDTVRFSPPR